MRADSIVFGIAGSLFGLIVGWVLGSQQAARSGPVAAPVAQAAPAPQAAPRRRHRCRSIPSAVKALEASRGEEPARTRSRACSWATCTSTPSSIQQAIAWYEQALALNPNDANVSTDLGVAYYYTNQPDRALTQFEQSLSIDPKHTKTLLNMGIVRAFGKQDLAGAGEGVAAGRRPLARLARGPGGEEGARRHQDRASGPAGSK